MKSGFVALIGKPNVGKSTILNGILGNKVSIVTAKSQTTRDNIQGIYNDQDSQIIFIDTPGIHKPQSDLGVVLDKRAYSSIRDCDLSVFVVDGSKEFNDGDQFLFDHLKFDCPVIIAFNKIDLTNIELITKLKKIYAEHFKNCDIIELSALENFNLDGLVKLIKTKLPEGPQYYDVDVLTDKDIKFHIQEAIREKCLKFLSEEVPHGIAVVCDAVKVNGREVVAECKIICEKESQKGIIIGREGRMIKKIGSTAREDLEKMTKKHVVLNIVVRVVKDWRNSSKYLVELGYND
ncbi:MAG: GTPase Era [Bacilli bacterium]|jgi:GTP-binding protein Era